MSRLTTAQVISLGQYLEPDFDPASLTVSQLLGVLGYHNIKYPTPYSKPKLIQLFNDEIKPRSAKFKKELVRKENSVASDEGIKDGLTGKPLTATRRTQPVRRSSRRLSQAPNQETKSSPDPQEPPRRRRSSAQPELVGSSRKAATVHPALMEESESEGSPIRRVIGSNKFDEIESESRRVSQTFADDSGWEENNIFQSGAEDSSPIRPSPAKLRSSRKSTAGKRSRKSASAPPQMVLSPIPLNDSNIVGNTQLPQLKFEKFEPDSSPSHGGKLVVHPLDREDVKEIDHKRFSELVVQPEECGKLDVVEEVAEDRSSQEKEEQTQTLQSSVRETPALGKEEGMKRSCLTVAVCLFTFILILAAGAALLQYKTESASIGYCERGANSNEYLDAIRIRRNATRPCNWENLMNAYRNWANSESTESEEEHQQTFPLCLPTPQHCTPCPDHATCDRHSVVCDTNYVLQPHPLLAYLSAVPSRTSASLSLSTAPVDVAWKVIHTVFDGLPILGSVALPPQCQEDPKRKRNIGALGKAIEVLLGQERGKRLCAGGKILTMSVIPESGGEAKKWGVELGQLRETMRKKTSPHLLASFDDTFSEAIQQLVRWGNVAIGEDQEGKRYLAHGTPNLTLACTLVVKSREVWVEWRATVLGLVLLFLIIVVGRARRAQRQAEAKRVGELVQTALTSLRNQEIAHHTDPITAPQPYLSSLQLRDLVLQDQHSIPVRKRLWDQVERIVEENANVRVNLQEVDGGDELRVWRWVGNAGRGAAGQIEGVRAGQDTES